MDDNEDDDIDGYDERANGKQLEVWHEPRMNHFEVAVFVTGQSSSIKEWQSEGFNLHLIIILIYSNLEVEKIYIEWYSIYFNMLKFRNNNFI